MVNGKFPPQQEAFNNFMAEWLPPIWSSLAKTEGGGYMYGGMQPGFWNDGAHGVITVRRDDTQYVHVLTKPRSQDLVRLRDNGYRVTGVTDVRTGKRVPVQPVRRVSDHSRHHGVGHVRHGVQGDDRRATRAVPAVDAQGDGASAAADHPAANLVDGDVSDLLGRRREVAGVGDAGPRPAAAGDVPGGEPDASGPRPMRASPSAGPRTPPGSRTTRCRSASTGGTGSRCAPVRCRAPRGRPVHRHRQPVRAVREAGGAEHLGRRAVSRPTSGS